MAGKPAARFRPRRLAGNLPFARRRRAPGIDNHPRPAQIVPMPTPRSRAAVTAVELPPAHDWRTTDAHERARRRARAIEDQPQVRRLEPGASVVGRYAVGPQRAHVTGEGATLVVDVAGQPRYELAPKRGDAFVLKGMSGYSVRFGPPGSGPAESATFHPPNGVFAMKRVGDD